MGLCSGYSLSGLAVEQCGSCLADVWSHLAVGGSLLSETFKQLHFWSPVVSSALSRIQRLLETRGKHYQIKHKNTHSILYSVNHIPPKNLPPILRHWTPFFSTSITSSFANLFCSWKFLKCPGKVQVMFLLMNHNDKLYENILLQTRFLH